MAFAAFLGSTQLLQRALSGVICYLRAQTLQRNASVRGGPHIKRVRDSAHRHFWLAHFLRLLVLFLVVVDLCFDFSVLFEQEQEHLVKLLVLLYLNFQTGLYPLNFLFKCLNLLQVFLLEVLCILCYVLVGNNKVLLELVVKRLPRNLYANSKRQLCVDNSVFQGSIQNPEVSLPGLFHLLELVILLAHDLMQMDFILKELIEIQSFEWLQHLLNHLLQILDQRLIIYFDGLLRNQDILLLDPLHLFL